MVDLQPIRRACLPVARWWDNYRATGGADPGELDAALEQMRSLGPIGGQLGAALAFIDAGCPGASFQQACHAFATVAAAAPMDDRAMPAEQLSLPGLYTPIPPTDQPQVRPNRRSARP